MRPGIEQDTELMPWVIADSVLYEASCFLNKPISTIWADWLDEHAERIYARNSHFRRLIRRKDETGRNYLHRFFRHWLASRMKRERVPAGVFCPRNTVLVPALGSAAPENLSRHPVFSLQEGRRAIRLPATWKTLAAGVQAQILTVKWTRCKSSPP